VIKELAAPDNREHREDSRAGAARHGVLEEGKAVSAFNFLKRFVGKLNTASP
jgi:hypothetical protein